MIIVKVLVGAFKQEKALVGAFSVIVKTDGSFAALLTRYLLCLPELLSTRSSGSVGCPILWSLSSIVRMGRGRVVIQAANRREVC